MDVVLEMQDRTIEGVVFLIPASLGAIGAVCDIFAGFGGPKWLRALERIMIVLEEESEAFLCLMVYLGVFYFDWLGGWSDWVPPQAGKFVSVLSVRYYGLMRVLISLALSFLCPKVSFR